MALKTTAALVAQPELTLEAKARLYVEIQEQQRRLKEQARLVQDDLLKALADTDGEPVDAGAYVVSLVAPKPRRGLDERKLLEAGVTMKQLDAATVEKPVSAYPKVTPKKDADAGEEP